MEGTVLTTPANVEKKTISTIITKPDAPTYIPVVATFEKVSFEQFTKDMITCYEKNNFGIPNEREIQIAYDTIKLPTRATDGSAGYDFINPIGFVTSKYSIQVPTGIRCKIAPGWALFIMPRSGLGFKYAARLANTIGVIDSDYYYADNEGDIMVKMTPHIFHNHLDISRGDKFCQGIFIPFGIVTNDSPREDKRHGGLGSTGK